jgi:molecular chaperone DnaK
MLIHVLQGERERAQDNWSLGKFTVDFQPAPRGVARVGVQFEIDASGILHVLARDIQTGKEMVVQMKSAVDVDDAAVQQMVEESVEHAFEDLAARRWIEAKLKAKQLVSATRKGLADCREELEKNYLIKVELAVRAVEAALDKAETDEPAPDPRELQSASAELDEITKPMAEVLIDRAMDALLRKKGIL